MRVMADSDNDAGVVSGSGRGGTRAGVSVHVPTRGGGNKRRRVDGDQASLSTRVGGGGVHGPVNDETLKKMETYRVLLQSMRDDFCCLLVKQEGGNITRLMTIPHEHLQRIIQGMMERIDGVLIL